MARILDGYEQRLTLRAADIVIHVVYRPATRSERDSIGNVVSLIGKTSGQIAIYKWISEHVVESDIQSLIEYPAWISVQRFAVDHPHLCERLWLAVNGLIKNRNGRTWVESEASYQRNLGEGILLEVTNPKLARRSCEECLRDWFNETTGEPIVINSSGARLPREGPTMCQTPTGCPKGTPEHQKALSRMNRMAFRHYRLCAASSFPDDARVQENALIIKTALESKAISRK